MVVVVVRVKKPSAKRILLSHTYETHLSREEKAARVAVVLKPRQQCKLKTGCENYALERNYGFCGSHGSGFIRKKGTSGHLCLAAEFMPNPKESLCDCEFPLCFEIGYYPTLGKFSLPSDSDMAKPWLKAIVYNFADCITSVMCLSLTSVHWWILR
eukprot:scaffold102133_cov61-Attheya_sp.AAC.5